MKLLVFIILFCSSPFAFVSDFYPDNQVERVVKVAIKEKDITLIRSIPVKEPAYKDGQLVLYEFEDGAGENFYVVISEAKGRYDYFDYLMAVSNTFKIKQIRVLKYRSEHGGEIKSKKWLEQFENYSLEKELRYKKEVSALSGATLSAQGLVGDVPKVLSILKASVE